MKDATLIVLISLHLHPGISPHDALRIQFIFSSVLKKSFIRALHQLIGVEAIEPYIVV